ncbi:plasmid partitioning protein RepB (plasmid) [Bosea vestrisii]|uniref:plasmid partitioning protein RepB n=1 Tax=Bosea vestrisii TaxID=151416 RepID=UPI0024DFBE4D|nr:plasmid partitioning protein RepB [Bosea vestrisii]WID99731.1 plasmid partitioning protein RepB [Bosea vestrisii]
MTKKAPRRSIVASFGALSQTVSEAELERTAPDEAEPQFASPPPRVPAGVIGATQRTLSDIREERDRLQAIVDAGAPGIADIDARLIDPSPFPDRLPDDDPSTFEAFKKSIAEDGQRVPVQLRPHPDQDGRYQVIYGHRRVRVAQELGVPVKAFIRPLSDSDLVVSQGLENASRQDLSWIERAVFARQMESAGVRARDIRGALSLDDPELAKMRSVWRSVPREMITAIGRAPKIGRPRWLELAAALERSEGNVPRALETLSADKVRTQPSDLRFQIVLAALSEAPKASQKTSLDLQAEGRRRLGKASFDGREIRLVVEAESAAAFASFFRKELPALMERFEASQDDG